MLHVTVTFYTHPPPLYFFNNNNIYIIYILLLKESMVEVGVCVKGYVTM